MHRPDSIASRHVIATENANPERIHHSLRPVRALLMVRYAIAQLASRLKAISCRLYFLHSFQLTTFSLRHLATYFLIGQY